MKQYNKYMDSVRASDTLHQRLLNLDTPQKRPAAWKKYGTMAAALALVVGAGAWGMAHGGWNALADRFQPGSRPEIAELDGPDIAPVEPGDVTEPGEKTIGGYEVTSGSGENAITAYYILPYIEYGEPSGVSSDLSLAPPDGGLRGAARDDVLALIGNEDALTAHLNWGGCEYSGTVGFEADGTVWLMSLWGERADVAFSLELSPNRLPPTCCVVIGEQRTITNVWGVEVSGVNNAGAYGDTERGVYMDVSREVEFIANGVGCRLKAYGTQDEAVEELVSRFVRWAVLEGLDLSGISPDGAKPPEIDPDYSVGEPNWNDSAPAVSAEPGYTCPTCGETVPAGMSHDCAMCDGYPAPHVCEVCGAAYPEGTAHSHGACGYPLAPDTHICEVCGETIPDGVAHDCAMCDGYPTPYVCEVCGQALPAGVEHSHQQEHHQEGHHGGRH